MSKRWESGSTAAWRRIRLDVLVRDQWRCKLKLPGCTTRATQVHHTRARELVGDDRRYLLAVCSHCNGSAGDPTRHDPPPNPRKWWE